MGEIRFDPKLGYTDRPVSYDSELRANLPDRVSKGPNTVFKTVDAAATDAMDHCRKERIQFVEYGGWIVKVPGGYTYTEIIKPNRNGGPHSTPGSVTLGDPPDGAVASFHTHPRRGDTSQVNGSDEHFSDGDRDAARWDLQHGVLPGTIYLHTPYGRVRRFDPKTNLSVTLRGPGLPGEGRSGE